MSPEDHILNVNSSVDEASVSGSRLLRCLFIGLGTLSLALGVLGAFVPVLPSTVFLILAAAAYARGSPRLYRWLLRNRIFGRYISDWRTHGSIPIGTKVMIVAMIFTAVGVSSYVVVESLILRSVVIALGLAGAGYVTFIVPTRR